MKVLILLLPYLASCLARDIASGGPTPGTQRGLLVLPKPAPSVSNFNQYTTKNYYNQQPQTPEILSPEFAERRGVYFVEVPQERIQALRGYSKQQIQNFQPSAQYNQQQSSPVNVRYLPLEDTQDRQQFYQQSNQEFQASAAAQYNQQQSTPVNVRYLPLEDQFQYPSPSSQYRQEPAEETPIVRYLPVPLTGEVQQYRR
ncbi:uncharacterized protein [Halyomorpha halys]|uniref:uncharacterized protein n=1 Tax=Halyomorpha halys TaxID=286706 RepID=UPI0006D4EFC9|nr:altered inheritance of mitochondria protein 3-like [Halyomorpha halys]